VEQTNDLNLAALAVVRQGIDDQIGRPGHELFVGIGLFARPTDRSSRQLLGRLDDAGFDLLRIG